MTAKYSVFKENYKNVEALQAKYGKKPNKNKFGITKFMDYTAEEFSANFANLKLTEEQIKESEEATRREQEALGTDASDSPPTLLASGDGQDTTTPPPLLGAPYSWDWRTQGVVGPVKNQGSCGGCWAFSANANLEGLYARKYGSFRSFSEEQLVDCDYSNNGCFGGNQQNAFDYIRRAGGLMSSTNYPYRGSRTTCSFRASLAAVRVKSWFNAGQNEESIKNYVYTTGPLSVAINQKMLQFYTGGIITSGPSTCSPNTLNHGVAIVGYGTQNGVNYWIVKNSWGPNWGEGGYFRISRGFGTCGINKYVVSAVLA
jgi:cathepsin F